MPAGWVEKAGAALGAAQSIAGNSSSKAATAANNVTSQQVSSAQGAMLNQAEQVASQPFQAYTGTLTAPMSGNQQQAYGLASSEANAGTAQSDNAIATGLAGQVAGNGWNANTAAQYSSPYTAAVTNAAITNANRSYDQSLSALNENAAQSGAFGGSRNAIAQSELAGQNQLNIGNLTATGNANAYSSALSAWQADNNTKLAASNAYENAGQDITQMNSQDLQNLLQTGGVSQAISQTDLSNQYQQFMRQQGWSAQQLGSLISAVGTAKGGSGTAQTPAVQSNTASQLLGLGSTLAGLWGQNGSTPNVSTSNFNSSLNNTANDLISTVQPITPTLTGAAAGNF